MQQENNIIIFELCEKGESAFVMDGTEGTANPIRLAHSDRMFIPNTGKAARVDEKGNIVYSDIRYIPGIDTIWVDEQKKLGIEYKPDISNRLFLDKDIMALNDSVENRTLLEFMKLNFNCEDAPNRPESADALYRIVRLEEKAEEVNDLDELETEAKYLVNSLRKKSGNGTVIYDEQKIEQYSKLLNIQGGFSLAEKLIAIRRYAIGDPESFLRLVRVFDNTINSEVAKAMELGVVKVSDGVAIFADNDKVIKPVGSGNMGKNKDIAIEEIASFFKTNEGSHVLTEMRAKVEVVQNKKLKDKK